MAVAAPLEYGERSRVYQPYGASLDLFYSRAPEVLLSGPAGTGKSRGCLEKLHYLAETYPGMRGLILRKTRASLTESALFTYEEKVLPVGHRALEGARRNLRQTYRYPNGTQITVGGMDNPARIMSTEFDIIYVQEAIELTENDWEFATTRLRNGVVPFQQLIADTNPDRPGHWLKRRCDEGLTVLLESRHEDNPTITQEYLANLDRLTGVRYHRLRHGRWVAAEGIVYEGWDAALHRVNRFTIPGAWPRYWSVDFGYSNPFVFQAWARDPDGRLYRYREIYRTHLLVEDAARLILRMMRQEPPPYAVICDHDAEDRATLERHLQRNTIPAYKAISAGIQAVQVRMRCAGDGKPRLFLMRESLDDRDEMLDEVRKPASTEEEIDGYIWNLAGGRKKGEEPVDLNNHGCDAMRYAVAYVDQIHLSALPRRPMVGGQRATITLPERAGGPLR